jgi:hypothetical protein
LAIYFFTLGSDHDEAGNSSIQFDGIVGNVSLTKAVDQNHKMSLKPTASIEAKWMASVVAHQFPVESRSPIKETTIPTCPKVTSTRNPSSSKRTPPNPETLAQPPSGRLTRNTVRNSTDLTIERSDSLVIVDEMVHNRQRDIVTILVGTLSCLTMATSLAAMYEEDSILAYVAFTFPLFVAPYVIHQRALINQLPTLRAAITKSQSQVSRITAETIQLHESIALLSGQLKKLAFVDDRLSDVAKTNNVDASSLRMLIYTNANLQRQITKAFQARDLQSLFTTILACDYDKDAARTTKALDQLLARLEAYDARLPRDVLRSALERTLIRKRKAAATPIHATVNAQPTGGCCDFYELSSH